MSIRSVSEWAKIAGRWTRYTYSSSDNSSASRTVLMIPGNPGNDVFYDDFTLALLTKASDLQIYTIAHLNHVPLPEGLSVLDPKQAKERFTLNEQIDHTYDFFSQIVEKSMNNKNLLVIGHSIGSYIGAVLKGRLEKDGYTINLVGLFPTLVDMAKSPAGLKMGPLINFVAKNPKVVRFLTWWWRWWPIEVKRFLVRPFVRNAPDCVVQAAAELLNGQVINNVGYMAFDELTNIHGLNPKVEDDLSHGKVHLYYGLHDKWVPLNYAAEMAKRIGKDRVIYDDTGADHAFVVHGSIVIANKVTSLFL